MKPTSPPAHPRSRGEHVFAYLRTRFLVGSSPLARGTLPRLWTRPLRERLIPARAGNTSRPARGHHLPAAHPRSRGEHGGCRWCRVQGSGSSPLARGTLACRSRRRPNHRLIPARAGNTKTLPSRYLLTTAHPRSRGEHGKSFYVHGHKDGSSPLARGTQPYHASALRKLRLIPARAGNTLDTRRNPKPNPAHPRSRGEHLPLVPVILEDFGSSPLARGTPLFPGFSFFLFRLIPARAGNTVGVPESTCRGSAHPRSRGEHMLVEQISEEHGGSSPLARGTPKILARPLFRVRLIPARAGNTTFCFSRCFLSAAHPRSRGEHGRAK